MINNITRREWIWAASWSAAIVLLLNLPYLYGAALSSPAHQFSGFVIGVEDGNTYLSKMQEGRAGYWLFYLAYTPEPHQGAPFFLYYILLGKLSALLGLSPTLALHLSRIFTVPFALLSFYVFAAYFSARRSIRQFAFFLFGVTAGFGWLWVLLGFPPTLGQMPVDMWVPDSSFFLSALTYPHLPLAVGLLLWVVIGTLEFLGSGRLKDWAIAAGAGLLVSLIHPYKLVITGAIFFIYFLWQAYCRPGQFWRNVWRLFLVTLPSAPYMLVVLTVFETNFAFKAWRNQSLTWSPAPIHYILGFGLILPLTGAGIWRARRMHTRYAAFLIVWAVTVPILLYVPLPLQRRFLDGYQAVLALLGAVGLVGLLERLRSNIQRIIVVAALFTAMILTNLLLWAGAMLTIGGQYPPVFYPGSQQLAINWLAQNAPGQVVLSTYSSGNVIPAYSTARVFIGHGPETAGSAEKLRLVEQFFAAETGQKWRQNLLAKYNVTYLFFGPNERAAGDFLPENVPYFQKVYDNGEVQLFRVVGE